MPTMKDIYDRYSDQYDELVLHEDYQSNLKTLLEHEIRENQTVLELGVGTGRVTNLYIEKAHHAVCCDRSGHMLEKAARNLAAFADKITFYKLDHRDLKDLDVRADLVIEGWALGHIAMDDFPNLPAFLDQLFADLQRILNPGGQIIFIETMGTHCVQPAPPDKKLSDFYDMLEQKHKMQRRIIRTDYKFRNVADARRISGIFLRR